MDLVWLIFVSCAVSTYSFPSSPDLDNEYCRDSDRFNCSSGVCTFEAAFHICKQTCNFCDVNPSEHPCTDKVVDLQCADLPNPCDDMLGMLSCPLFCGLCGGTVSTASSSSLSSIPTTTVSPSADPCRVQPCLNGGTCLAHDGFMFMCQCPPGLDGRFCQLEHVTGPIATHGPVTQASTSPSPMAATSATSKPTSTHGPVTQASTSASPMTATSATSKPTSTEETTSRASPTPTNAPSCTPINKHQLGSSPAEIVFMLEIAGLDSWCDIAHAGDFIRHQLGAWNVDQSSIRVGLVLYKDTATEAIRIEDFPSNVSGVKSRIQRLAGDDCKDGHGTVNRGGHADLAKALTYVRNNAFSAARPNVPKVVIPIIHEMPDSTEQNKLDDITSVAQKLREDTCTSIIGIAVYHDNDAVLNWPTVLKAVSHPYGDHMWTVDNFNGLEHDDLNCDYGIVNKNNVGCNQAEVVFMIEYAEVDQAHCGTDHQGDYIANLVNTWDITHTGTRFSVVTYHDTAEQRVRLNDFENNTSGLKSAIHDIFGGCPKAGLHASGNANFTNAMDFVRATSFTVARPGVPKVVIPIIHEMPSSRGERDSMVAASQRVKDQCITVLPLVVRGTTINNGTAQSVSSSKPSSHLQYFSSHLDLEGASKHNNYGRRHC